MNSSELNIKTLSPNDIRWNSFVEKFSKTELINLLRDEKLNSDNDKEFILLKEKISFLKTIISQAQTNLNLIRILDA